MRPTWSIISNGIYASHSLARCENSFLYRYYFSCQSLPCSRPFVEIRSLQETDNEVCLTFWQSRSCGSTAKGVSFSLKGSWLLNSKPNQPINIHCRKGQYNGKKITGEHELSFAKAWGTVAKCTINIFAACQQLVSDQCSLFIGVRRVFLSAVMGEIQGSDPVNSAEACMSYWPAYCCERIPDSSHTAALPVGGGRGKSNPGPETGADGLSLLDSHSGVFCVKCECPTSNRVLFMVQVWSLLLSQAIWAVALGSWQAALNWISYHSVYFFPQKIFYSQYGLTKSAGQCFTSISHAEREPGVVQAGQSHG